MTGSIAAIASMNGRSIDCAPAAVSGSGIVPLVVATEMGHGRAILIDAFTQKSLVLLESDLACSTIELGATMHQE